MIAAAVPNPLWFVSRGLGAATLVMLTASLLVGIVAGAGVRSPGWPRFASAGLHRNLSLFAMALLTVHVVTAILDPFARIAWRDAVVPFVSVYRPVWVGFGAIALDLLVAVGLTTAVRRRIGYRAWRTIHWIGYACWPPAILHTLGTGTDVRAPWMAAIGAICLLAVAAVVGWRLATADHVPIGVRGIAQAVVVSTAVGIVAFTAIGPLRPGWARVSGTPAEMLGGGRKTAAVASAAPVPVLVDPGTGAHRIRATVVGKLAGSTTVVATDLADPSVQVVVRPARAGESSPVLALLHAGRLGCVSPAVISDVISARCGSTLVRVRLEGPPADPTGWLWVGSGG